jgi:LacI family transcriptional regulator
MKPRITVRDIAKQAGVSHATASRVLGGYGYVSEEKREAVLEKARQMGYRPHAIARSMVHGKTKTVGFVVGDIENPFFSNLVMNINALISPQAYTMMVYTTNENLDEEIHGVETLLSKQVDGLIIAPCSSQNYSHIVEAHNSGTAVVLVDRVPDSLNIDSVRVGNALAIQNAMQHLFDLGHRKIGFLSDSLDIASNRERLKGFREAYQEQSLSLDPELIKITGHTILDGYRGSVSLLSQSNRPSAIITANNFMTTGFLLAAKDMLFRIPEAISLISFDELDWYKLIDPPITTIAQPLKRISQEVARLLLRRMLENENIAQFEDVVLKTSLVTRKSTAEAKQP